MQSKVSRLNFDINIVATHRTLVVGKTRILEQHHPQAIKKDQCRINQGALRLTLNPR